MLKYSSSPKINASINKHRRDLKKICESFVKHHPQNGFFHILDVAISIFSKSNPGEATALILSGYKMQLESVLKPPSRMPVNSPFTKEELSIARKKGSMRRIFLGRDGKFFTKKETAIAVKAVRKARA